jgi:RND family efflux transporter MFP subunit
LEKSFAKESRRCRVTGGVTDFSGASALALIEIRPWRAAERPLPEPATGAPTAITSPRRWPAWIAASLLLAVALLVLWWIVFRPLRVAAITVRPGSFAELVTAPGYLTSLQRAALGPRTASRLLSIEAEVGAVVDAGDVLARFADEAQAAELGSAEATLAAAEAELAGAQAQRALAETTVATAEAATGRQRVLVEAETISRADLERSEQALADAQGALAASAAALATAEARRNAADAARATALAVRDELTLRAPFAGEVVASFAAPGEIVAAAAQVVEIADPEALAIELRVDETALQRLAVGQPANIRFPADAETTLAGEVAVLDRRLDAERRDARVLVRLGQQPPDWTLDQRADVEVVTGQRTNALVLPLAAIGWRDGTPFVLVIEDDKTARRELVLGPADRSHVVVAAGLAAGERVLLDTGLAPGRPVEVLP